MARPVVVQRMRNAAGKAGLGLLLVVLLTHAGIQHVARYRHR